MDRRRLELTSSANNVDDIPDCSSNCPSNLIESIRNSNPILLATRNDNPDEQILQIGAIPPTQPDGRISLHVCFFFN